MERVFVKLQALVYDILPSTTTIFSYAIGSRKLSANEQFFVGAQLSSKFVTNNSNKTRCVIYSRQQSLHQHKHNHNRLNRDGTLFFTRGGCASCLRACFGARLLLQSYYYPNLSEGTEHVAGRLCGDKKYPFSGVTKSGRVWRRVLESDAWSVSVCVCWLIVMSIYIYIQIWIMCIPSLASLPASIYNTYTWPCSIKHLFIRSLFLSLVLISAGQINKKTDYDFSHSQQKLK